MQIRIKSDAHGIYARKNRGMKDEWYDKLKAVAGKTLEVETAYLFKDQFNTAPVEGVSEIGLRIMATSVEEVIDDEREYMLRCTYCGQVSEVSAVHSARCPHCRQGSYLVPLLKSAEISYDYKLRAKAERVAGATCDVDDKISFIGLTRSDGFEYCMQGEVAEAMIKEYEELDWLSCSLEEYLLATAQNW